MLLAAALLCALPARGAEVVLPDAVVHALTPIDSVPSTAVLDVAFAPEPALDQLREIALAPPVDPLTAPPLCEPSEPGDPCNEPQIQFGVQLRAIRALPSYCPPEPAKCGPGTVARDTLFGILASYLPLPSDRGATLPAHHVLRLRAAAEALGATRSDQNEDVAVLAPLLASPSRDVRATAIRALRNFCSTAAQSAVRSQLGDPSAQVRAEIVTALQVFEQCPR